MAMEISERVGHAAKNTVTGKEYAVEPASDKRIGVKKKKSAAKKTSKKGGNV